MRRDKSSFSRTSSKVPRRFHLADELVNGFNRFKMSWWNSTCWRDLAWTLGRWSEVDWRGRWYRWKIRIIRMDAPRGETQPTETVLITPRFARIVRFNLKKLPICTWEGETMRPFARAVCFRGVEHSIPFLILQWREGREKRWKINLADWRDLEISDVNGFIWINLFIGRLFISRFFWKLIDILWKESRGSFGIRTI